MPAPKGLKLHFPFHCFKNWP